jgi:hypothetical protein
VRDLLACDWRSGAEIPAVSVIGGISAAGYLPCKKMTVWILRELLGNVKRFAAEHTTILT